MDEKSKIEWADTKVDKLWVIDDHEVKAGTLKDALAKDVRYRTALYAVIVESGYDDEHDIEHERMCAKEDELELTDDELWSRVWDSRNFWMEEVWSTISHKDATPESMLEAVFLTWDRVEIREIECNMNYCGAMVDAVLANLCPGCDSYICGECVDEELNRDCPACDYRRTSLDAWARAVEDGRKEAA